MFYTGPSMNPTLNAGDTIYFVPYGTNRILSGDVIVFKLPGHARVACHRVVSVDAEGRVRTRGDNNNLVDPWDLRPEEILGRVVCAHRGKRMRRIFGGVVGRMFGTAMRFKPALRSQAFRFFQPVYRRLAESEIFRRLNSRIETRVVCFHRADSKSELQLLIGRRLVARLSPGQDRWRIKPPFRLFVNEDALPIPEHDNCHRKI